MSKTFNFDDAEKFPIIARTGNKKTRILKFWDDPAFTQASDLSGWTLNELAIYKEEGGSKLFSLSPGDNFLIASNELTVVLDLEARPLDPGAYFYQLDITVGGEKQTIFGGPLQIYEKFIGESEAETNFVLNLNQDVYNVQLMFAGGSAVSFAQISGDPTSNLALEAILDQKADQSAVDASIQALNSAMVAGLETKADEAATDAALDAINTDLGNKADTVVVDAALNNKLDNSGTNADLNVIFETSSGVGSQKKTIQLVFDPTVGDPDQATLYIQQLEGDPGTLVSRLSVSGGSFIFQTGISMLRQLRLESDQIFMDRLSVGAADDELLVLGSSQDIRTLDPTLLEPRIREALQSYGAGATVSADFNGRKELIQPVQIADGGNITGITYLNTTKRELHILSIEVVGASATVVLPTGVIVDENVDAAVWDDVAETFTLTQGFHEIVLFFVESQIRASHVKQV
jgi:hypothetical protein